MPDVIISPHTIRAEWLTDALRRSGSLPQGQVASVRVTSAPSYTSNVARLTLTYSDDAPSTAPARLFLKIGRPDPQQVVVGNAQRRAEVDFHNRVVAHMPDPPTVRCHQAVYCADTGASHLLFDDLSATHCPGVAAALPQPPQPPPRQAGRAMDAFAQFHAFWWDHPALGDMDMLPSQASVAEHVSNTRQHFPQFADAAGDRLTGSQRQVYDAALAALSRLWSRVTRGKDLTLIHGDANWSNVLLPRDPHRHGALIIDWQLWGVGFAAEDLAHLMALYWDKEQRQQMEKDLLTRYHLGLIRHGVENYQWSDCWHDYRLAILLRVLFMPLWFWLSGSSESRWQGSLARAMQAVDDLGCLDLLEK